MKLLRPLLAAVLAVLLVAPPALAQGDDNEAVAVNTEDGGTVFDLAFSIRKVTDGVVDQTNTAVAYASCTDCTTVALAFQVVLVYGDADVVVPENRSLALNDQCAECLTYASATQLVIGVDGPTRLSGEGHRRLNDLRRSLRALEDELADLTPAELVARVSAAEQELLDIFTTELVPAGRPQREDGDEEETTTTSSTSTTSTSTPSSTTTSSTTSSTSTTTSTTSTSTSTTTTTAP